MPYSFYGMLEQQKKHQTYTNRITMPSTHIHILHEQYNKQNAVSAKWISSDNM